jgi:hypothetical protein
MSDDQGLLAVWTDVDAAVEPDFHAWYNREHLRERVEIPGFLNARRYRATAGNPAFLALYDTQSLAVLSSPVYQRALANPSQWSRRVFPGFRNSVRMLGEAVANAGGGLGAHVLALRFRAAAGQSAALRAALAGGLAGRLMETQTVVRVTAAAGELATIKEFPAASGAPPQDPAVFALFVEASDPETLERLGAGPLADAALAKLGAALPAHRGRYALQYGLVRTA